MTMHKAITSIILAIIILFHAPAANSQAAVANVRAWGEFGDKPGQFKYPTMIAADHTGNVYVVDQHNHRVQKFDSSGKFILMWGKKGSGDGEFNYPYGIAVDSKGNVYVSDMNNNRVQKFSANGIYLASIGKYGTGDGEFKYPYGIAVGPNDIVYVIDAFNYRVQKFTAGLQFIGKWGSAESIGIKLYMPHEIAMTKNGEVILSDRQNHRIACFDADGKLLRRFGHFGEGRKAAGGEFSEPHGIAVHENGDIFITDRYNFRVQQFTSNDSFKQQWLTSGIADNSRYFPLGIVVTTNYVYVSDHYAHTIVQYKLYTNE